MAFGRIVRAVAGFFYVEPFENQKEPLECCVRGKLKFFSSPVLVGDKVEYLVENEKGIITNILPRENALQRPYIANVDLLVLVFSHKNPDPVDYLITKFLVLAEKSSIPYLILFNKTDLVSKRNANLIAETYRSYGYQVLCTSVKEHLGKRKLLEALKGKVAVFAGPSGVGKSALLNMISPGLELQTGVVSQKIGRGKHTTREVQLYRSNKNSYIADTPGFSQISFEDISPNELTDLLPDFAQLREQCRFSTCLHLSEPDCGVKKALSEGKIKPNRYQDYIQLLNEIKDYWKNRFK